MCHYHFTDCNFPESVIRVIINTRKFVEMVISAEYGENVNMSNM